MINHKGPACDLLVISAHTDDAEIGLGGTIRLLADKGRRVWAVDLTRGELGTNATPDERWVESQQASAVLGLAGRAQLDLPDGFIDSTDREQVSRVVAVIRRLKPRWIVTAPDPVRHPDHRQTPELVVRASFLSRLVALQPEKTGGRLWKDGETWTEPAERWEPEAVFSVCPDNGAPAVIFDISATWPAKQQALACYASQFSRQDGRVSTWINDDVFMEKIERRARTWGSRGGVELGEALASLSFPVMTDLPVERWGR
ncbi:MAG: bacillithiol biosynthesis deacetylase BshB1 [Candidatus Krumholzibacteria bacterium]|nr:bacillithiol biosynthesis deacetylase BshB1 [Candidatus Krumholzibacteria bacterium]